MTSATLEKVRIVCEAISIAACAVLALTLAAYGGLHSPFAWMVYSTAGMAFGGLIRLGWTLAKRSRSK
jgi:hypothetical protein